IVAGGKGHDVVEEIAQLVQRTCKYRWVGVYKIKRKDFVIEAATNKMKPACPRFPVTQGLSAKAMEDRRTVMVRDVRKEPCFLPNFWSTNSEVGVPIIDDEHDRVVGEIHVQSAKVNAFNKPDRDCREEAATITRRRPP